MSKKTGYWYLDLEITSGDIEFHSKSLHKGKKFDPNEYAKDFYDDRDEAEVEEEEAWNTDAEDEDVEEVEEVEDVEEGVYSFQGGQIVVSVCDCREISKKDYDVLKKYL